MDLLRFFDELVAIIQPGQEGDESPLPGKDSSVFLKVVDVEAEGVREGEYLVFQSVHLR